MLEEGLEPHRVRRIMLASASTPDTWIDISETIGVKIEALRQHASQLAEPRDYEHLLRSWAAETGTPVGLACAEAFMRIVRPRDRSS
jgi:LmbE family N-acetylglucosaminyl deacetylase